MGGVGVTEMPSRFVLDTDEVIGNADRVQSAYLECENIARAASPLFRSFRHLNLSAKPSMHCTHSAAELTILLMETGCQKRSVSS